MATPKNSALGIRQTSEGAWLAWLKSKIRPGTALAKANLFPGQSTEEIELPALIVACNSTREHIAFTGYTEADLDIMVMSSPDAGTDADELQARMIGELEQILTAGDPGSSVAVQAISAEISVMTGFNYTVIGFWVDGQTGQAVEQHWVDMIKLKVHCMAASGLAPS